MAEQGSLSQEQMNEFLFMQIVMMFQGAALQHMGKVMNPMTQKVERDLAQAKNAIDILGMLEMKTRGNLSDDEKRMLEHALYELRMNYVDEANKGEREVDEKDEAAPEDENADGDTPQEEPAEGEKADQDPPQEAPAEGEKAEGGESA